MGTNGNRGKPGVMNRLADLSYPEHQLRAILAERATTLARVADDDNTGGHHLQHVVFSLGSEKYAIGLHHIEEIRAAKNLSAIPCTPDFMIGAVNVRGTILPVIDLKYFFALPPSDAGGDRSLIIANVEGVRLSLLVDNVRDIAEVDSEKMQPKVATLSGAPKAYIRGITDDAIIVIDLAPLVKDKRLAIHEDVSDA